MSNYKIKYMLMTVASVLTIGVMSFLVFNGIKRNKDINNPLSKSQIRNKILNDDPSNSTINSIFINTTPDKVSTIYVGGKDLKVSSTSTKFGALIISSDNGKTWVMDEYFANPTDASAKNTPIINKIMTDFYTDKAGTSDSIVVSGQYLKSIAAASDRRGSGNGNSTSAGQIAYENVYHAIAGSTINTITKTSWMDVADRDFDSSAGKGFSQKVMTASTVISSVQTDPSTPEYVQDHVYIITNDESINVNDIKNISHKASDGVRIYGKNKFSAYDFVNAASDISKAPTESIITALSSYLNSASIYGTVVGGVWPIIPQVTNTTFDADASSFVFMSGINKTNNQVGDNLCFIAENQHYDKQPSGSKTLPNNSSAFDKPLMIQYDITTADSAKTGATYIVTDPRLPDYPLMNNFLIKTIAINPEIKTDDGQNDFPLLILAGEKDDASSMISPNLEISAKKPFDVQVPTMPTNSTFKINKNTSYISKVIPVNVFKPKNSSNPNVQKIIEPLILFGKNMKSSNANMMFPDDTEAKFIPNTQNLTGQGIMLANRILTDTTEGKGGLLTNSVFYSVPKNNNAINPSMVNYVDNSNDYNSIKYQSFQSDYTFVSSTYNTSSLFENNGSFNHYKVTKDKNNNFNFSNATNNNSKNNIKKTIEIVIPVIIIILLISSATALFFFLKRKKFNILKNFKKINIFKDSKKFNIFKGGNKLSVLKDSKKLNMLKFYKNINIYKNSKKIIKKLSEFKFPTSKKK